MTNPRLAFQLPRGYAYLASPYSHPEMDVVERRVQQTQLASLWLIHHGWVVYSPILHWHSTAGAYGVGTTARDWIRQNETMLRDAKEGLMLLQLEGWRESLGVQMELDLALELALPIREISPTYNPVTDTVGWIMLAVLGDPRVSP